MQPENRVKKIEWLTVGLIIFTYLGWFFSGLYLWPNSPIVAIVIMILSAALHSSLVHEALHGHPTRNNSVNEALVTISLSMTIPYRRYKELHLKHHADERLTDPHDDPESYYRSLWEYESMPSWMKVILQINQTMIGRIVIGPILTTFAFWMSEARLLNQKRVLIAWIIHGFSCLLVALTIICVFEMPLWIYVLTIVWGALAIISMRTYAEHQWHETAEGRTIIVENSPFAFLFLNNNLHIVHHKNPTVAWYKLPSLYKAQRTYWKALNKNYVFQNYCQLLCKFAFKSKEPIVHPKWRR